MKTLYGLLAATLLLSFTVCSDSIARESFESSGKATKIEIGRYQRDVVGNGVLKLDTTTGETEVLGVLNDLLTFVRVLDSDSMDFGFPKGKEISLPADDPRVKQYLEYMQQLHGQYIRGRALQGAQGLLKLSK